MKIICEQGNGVFIATVTRSEIEKLHDKYYAKDATKRFAFLLRRKSNEQL